MKRLNQKYILNKYHYYNLGLVIIFIVLLFWVGFLFYKEIMKKRQKIQSINIITNVSIIRKKNTLEFTKKNNKWYMLKPFKSLASSIVIEEFLYRLHNSCHKVDRKIFMRNLHFYARAKTIKEHYQIGELNPVADKIYIKTLSPKGDFKQLSLCDKLLGSMSMSPAINFINKQLYQGELIAIKGSFGTIDNFSDIDLSVFEVAFANARQAKQSSISNITFISNLEGNIRERHYKVLLNTGGDKKLLLFDSQKSLIYVIAMNPKINAILGL